MGYLPAYALALKTLAYYELNWPRNNKMSSKPELNNHDSDLLTASNIKIHTQKWLVTVADQPIDLTYIEYLILKALMIAKGKVISRQILLEQVWGYGNGSLLTTRTVDVHIGRLRKKLGDEGSHIITVRNVGYRMALSPDWISR